MPMGEQTTKKQRGEPRTPAVSKRHWTSDDLPVPEGPSINTLANPCLRVCHDRHEFREQNSGYMSVYVTDTLTLARPGGRQP